MARALHAWAINRRGENLVCNLQYSPRTQLVRGMYMSLLYCAIFAIPHEFFLLTINTQILAKDGTNLVSWGACWSRGARVPRISLISISTLFSWKSLRTWSTFLTFGTFNTENLSLFTFRACRAWISRLTLGTLEMKQQQ